MQYLRQNDPRWGFEKLGKTVLSVARYGCTITCLSMLTDYFKPFHAPNYLAHNLDFMTDPEHVGLLVWNSVDRELGFSLKSRIQGIDFQRFDEGCNRKDMATMLEVNNSHWVVAIRRIPLTNTYIIVDPIDGKKKSSYRYKITGGAVFVKKS